MREPSSSSTTFGVLAEFPSGEDLIEGVKKVRAEGFTQIDAYTPFPIEALDEAMALSDNRVPWVALAGGLIGAAIGYGLQVYTNLAYPIPVGNRPPVAPQAFMLIAFELMVLGAVLSAVIGMFLFNRLPRLNHPVFEAQGFGFGAESRFFLIVFGNDARFGETETSRFLQTIGASRVQLVRGSEEPA
ncbi:MAG: DUF3341 domain-containing protein [Methylobacterium mesophilicum]|nr:DUF3341 domain-containing protein [Methylobacterium mesophilicum]